MQNLNPTLTPTQALEIASRLCNRQLNHSGGEDYELLPVAVTDLSHRTRAVIDQTGAIVLIDITNPANRTIGYGTYFGPITVDSLGRKWFNGINPEIEKELTEIKNKAERSQHA